MAVASETSFSVDIKENLLQCAICCSQFTQPKVLSCQHSFCMKCLKGWLQTRNKKTKSIQCAVCRATTRLPSDGVKGLPENYVIKGLISLVKSRSKKLPAKSPIPSKNTKGKHEPATRKVSKIRSPATDKVIVNSMVAGKSKGGNPRSRAAGKAVAKVVADSMVAAKSKGGESSKSNKDKNDNMSRNGKKKNTPIENSETSNSEEEEDDDSSDSEDSEESSSNSDESSDGASSSNIDSSLESEDDESDVPPTPTLKSYGEMKVGMQVYVFNRRGKPFPGCIKLMEKCQLPLPSQPRTYAGIELRRENASLTTDDLDDIDDSYLSHWLGEYENPCAVVRVEDCIPASLLDEIMESRVNKA